MKQTYINISKQYILLLAMLLVFAASIRGQYISEVLEYKPAPGQHINNENWGIPSSANSIVGGLEGKLSLGAFGGYVVFRFDGPVENHPDNPFGVDFSIYGNAMEGLSEAGIVYVMKDGNQNGLADDTWHELAGSDHYFSTYLEAYEVQFANPQQPVAADVPWTDNLGRSGHIYANETHTQPYYPLHDSFPVIPNDQYSLQGNSIFQPVDTLSGIVRFPQRAFGYADNKSRGLPPYTLPDNPYTHETENGGGDAFDISWAVDEEGHYIELDEIHFVKVQTASMQNGGWLGEVSTEISGAIDITPDPGLQGTEDMIVIRDLPLVLDTSQYQLEVMIFHNGKPLAGQEVLFTASLAGAEVTEDHLLIVSESGSLEITARLAEDPDIFTTAKTLVDLSSGIGEQTVFEQELVYPNPAIDLIKLRTEEKAGITIYPLNGISVFQIRNYQPGQSISLSHLPAGLYIIRIQGENFHRVGKIIKK
ncbi:MAG: T9SS type A sorting domain-containing protein [Bacteroidota bacterium]|nr:T9SS type A sorting domain-containing protein [Bacteroidota bacterium]